jgi:hypothetical protein
MTWSRVERDGMRFRQKTVGRFVAEFQEDNTRRGRRFAISEPVGTEFMVAIEGQWYLSIDRLERVLEHILVVLGPRGTSEVPIVG